ncbi:hypothetical protein ACV229_26695 [Burkholderia sp. MR1-5-21]
MIDNLLRRLHDLETVLNEHPIAKSTLRADRLGAAYLVPFVVN